MKDELSLAGETEDVQAVKAKIMKLFKDIVSTSVTYTLQIVFLPSGLCISANITRGNGNFSI